MSLVKHILRMTSASYSTFLHQTQASRNMFSNKQLGSVAANSQRFTSTFTSTVKPITLDTGLTLTPSCIRRLRQITTPAESYLRITISGGGCSGFQYGFEMDSTVGPDDRLIGDENGTALVVIDSTSLSYVAGSTVDYFEELIRTGFRIMSNPQADGGCSCGASFSIKM